MSEDKPKYGNNKTPQMTAKEFQEMSKKGKKRNSPESDMQQRCVSWFKSSYPNLAKCLVGIPNAQKREVKTDKNGRKYVPSANRQLAEGLNKGALDIFIAVPSYEYHGYWLEAKIKPNKASDDQIIFIQNMTDKGYLCDVFYTYEEFKILVDKYLE